MKPALALLLLAGTARATPIEPLWETQVHCTRHDLVPSGDALAWIDGDKVMRVDRATGTLAKPLRLAKHDWDGAGILGALGDAWLVETWKALVVVDAATGAVRWQEDAETAFVLDGDVIVLRHKDGGVLIDRLAGATGKRLWHAATLPGVPSIGWTATDGARLYIVTATGPNGESYLSAFDVANGKALWSHAIAGKGLGIALLGAAIVYSDGSPVLRVVDGATGAPRPDIPIGAPARELAVDATHLYAATATSIVAYDTIKHAIQWTQQHETNQLLGATPAGVFVLTNGQEMLRALDPQTGTELASYGIADTDLIATARDHRAPMFVTCDREHTMTAFDPTGHAVPTEHATISGTLVCTNCKQPLPELAVTIGDVRVQTDKRGRFAITLDARGALTLAFDLPPIDAPKGWAPSSSRRIELRGKRRYDLGRLAVRRDCGPMQPPCE